MLCGKELAKVYLLVSSFSKDEQIAFYLAFSLDRLISLVKPGPFMG